MEAVEAYYDGRVFIPRRPVSARKNQPAIVTILNDRSEDLAIDKASLFPDLKLSTKGYFFDREAAHER
jgi:hypothetical protein